MLKFATCTLIVKMMIDSKMKQLRVTLPEFEKKKTTTTTTTTKKT